MSAVTPGPTPDPDAASGSRLLQALVAIRDATEGVETVLEGFMAGERNRWADVDPEVADLFDTVSALVMSGGKRLRPAFCHWAFIGAGGSADDPAVDLAGAALEMLHSFALFHDDVMDDSSERRGRPTAHTTWQRRHADQRWGGDGRRFGEAVAILAGDLAFVWADQLLPLERPDVQRLWIDLRSELAVGQFLDILATSQGRTSTAMARRIVRFKTAKYTVERPLHLGAALAGRLDELAEPLSAVGLPLGDAFQLRDDLLGVYGDHTRTGKPVGEDLRDGKPTVLVALARERLGDDVGVLVGLGDPTLDDVGVRRLQGVIAESGAVDQVEALIDELTDQAQHAIAALPFADDVKASLAGLAAAATHRDR